MAKSKIKQGDAVCYWLAYGQPYAATVDEVYTDQIGAGGGPTVDLTFGEGEIGRRQARHVQYNPEMQPHSYCLPADPGWPGTLPKPGVAGVEAAPAEVRAAEASVEVIAKPAASSKASKASKADKE